MSHPPLFRLSVGVNQCDQPQSLSLIHVNPRSLLVHPTLSSCTLDESSSSQRVIDHETFCLDQKHGMCQFHTPPKLMRDVDQRRTLVYAWVYQIVEVLCIKAHPRPVCFITNGYCKGYCAEPHLLSSQQLELVISFHTSMQPTSGPQQRIPVFQIISNLHSNNHTNPT